MQRAAFSVCALSILPALMFCSPKTNGSPADDFGRTVSYAELRQWLADTQVQTVLVDIRRDDEIANGMVPGAVHIPLADLEKRIHELPIDARIVLYCRTGRRVKSALPIFREKGYRVYNFVSFSNWQGALEKPL